MGFKGPPIFLIEDGPRDAVLNWVDAWAPGDAPASGEKESATPRRTFTGLVEPRSGMRQERTLVVMLRCLLNGRQGPCLPWRGVEL